MSHRPLFFAKGVGYIKVSTRKLTNEMKHMTMQKRKKRDTTLVKDAKKKRKSQSPDSSRKKGKKERKERDVSTRAH